MKHATKTTKKAAAKAASSNAVIAAQSAAETKPLTGETAQAARAKASAKAIEPAEKPAPKKAKKAAAPKPEPNSELSVHINPSGRVCFGKAAAARIGDMAFMTITHEGKLLRMIATNRQSEGAFDINRASGRPYVSATKILKAAGLFNGEAADLIAEPYNGHGFDFKAKAAPAEAAAA
jgi:hypothetical protein